MKHFVVFDLDGTLIDTLNGLTKTSNDFLLKFKTTSQKHNRDVAK